MYSGQSLALLLVHEQHDLVLARWEDLADLEVVGDDTLVVQNVPAFRVTTTSLPPKTAHVDDLSLGEGAEKGALVVLVEDRDADQVCRQLHRCSRSCTPFGALESEDLRCTLSTTSAVSDGTKRSWATVSEPGIGPQAPASLYVQLTSVVGAAHTSAWRG